MLRKLVSAVMAMLMVSAVAAVFAEGTETSRVTGSIEDDAYVLTVKLNPDEEGEWRADEMAQDDSVVRLAFSGVEGGVFTARYEPAGDGEVSVYLRHYNAHTCDEMLGFDLLVKDGKVQEVTGGSHTASPAEEELDPYFSGTWLEKDTQFTALEAAKRPGGGWDIAISSPMTHGAYVLRASAYYDCDYDAFVYADGVKYDLLPGEETEEKEAESGLWGTLRFAQTEDGLQLVWYGMEASGNEEVAFEAADETGL